ncbi:MAG: hypothetical protein GEU95_00360 [Rhizobiales bacterium]|nr:hypothetical protein [Hyphomicrobiales bacterium]
MTPKFTATIVGCMIAGAASAAYLRSEGWRPTSPATTSLATISPEAASPADALPPLFLQAATEAPASASWPPGGSVAYVAYYEETFALLTTTAAQPASQAARTPAAADDPAPEASAARQQTASVTGSASQTRPPRDANVETADQPRAGGRPRPPRAGGTRPRANDKAEVVTRDRFARPIRGERVQRRRFAAPRAYPPPPHRIYETYPHGPGAGYGPYHR